MHLTRLHEQDIPLFTCSCAREQQHTCIRVFAQWQGICRASTQLLYAACLLLKQKDPMTCPLCQGTLCTACDQVKPGAAVPMAS